MPVPTLRRSVKFTPAVIVGLLVVAWVVSLFAFVSLNLRLPQRWVISVGVAEGNICWLLIGVPETLAVLS
jgi:hypothetical protein